jgi:hypothetical protein
MSCSTSCIKELTMFELTMCCYMTAAHLGAQKEAVANQGGDDLPSRQTPELAIINGHGLNRDGDQRFLGDLDVFGNRLPVLD